jgi:hypothetical protein
MDNAQKHKICTDVPSSQTFRSYNTSLMKIQRVTPLTNFSSRLKLGVVFLSFSRQIPGLCLKVGHDFFLSQYFLSITQVPF